MNHHQETKQHIGAYVSLKQFIKTENRIQFLFKKISKESVEKFNGNESIGTRLQK